MHLNKGVALLCLLILLLVFLPVHAARPTVNIAASPTTILAGESSTLTWASTGATSASINNGIGSVPVNGSMAVTPVKTTTYTIMVRNSSGSRTASAKVTVKAALPTVNFGSSPESIQSGQGSTLSWTTTHATSASINQGIGAVALNGSRTVQPTATTTYTMTVKGSGGTVTASTTVAVAALPPTVSISTEPLSILPGESSTLSWASANAISAIIDNDVGEVDLNGSVDVAPAQTTTYTITASNGSETASAAVTVTVVQSLPQVSLKAFPSVVLPGEATTLCWRTEHVDSASIDNGVGEVPVQGFVQVNPATTTAYTISATGPGGTMTASTAVEVDGTLPPSVSLHSSPEIVKEGNAIVLSWNSSHAEAAEIDNGIGGVPAGGSLRVTPDSSTTYTIIVGNANGTATASVKVDVKSSPKCHSYIPGGPNNTMTVINNKNMSVIKTLPVGSDPSGCAVSPDGMSVYIGNNMSHSISVIDTGTNTVVSTMAVGVNPKYLALSPGGEYLYVANDYGYNIIEVVDTKTGQVATELHVGGYCEYVHGMALHPDGSKLYVAISSLPDLGKVVVIDTASNEIMFEIPVGATYDADCDVAVSPDGSRLYWICGPGDSNSNFFVIDTATNAVITGKRIKQSNGSPAQLLDLAVLPDDSKLYVLAKEDSGGNPLSTVDAATFAVSKVAYSIYTPKNIGIDPDGSRVFVVGSSFLNSFYTNNNSYGGGISLKSGSVAHGNFIGHVADTVSGQVTNNGVGVAGITVTATGEGITKTALTDAGGSYSIALGNGTYTITPSNGGDVFSPQNWRATVEQSLSGKNFAVIDTGVAPTVTLQASPLTIMAGGSATLSWTSTNAATATIDNGIGDVLINGSLSVTPAATTTYAITVSNTVLTASATAKITVILVKPTVTISASPASIEAGQSSTLTWTSTNATSAVIDQEIGTVPVSDTKTVAPQTTTKYTITVTGAGGTATASATVTVGYDTSAKLTGTVTDHTTSQPLADVTVSALDASGLSKTALTGTDGKYFISGLRIGEITISFVKTGYDPSQQTINIPTNTTFDLTTQLQQTLVGATFRGVVKDGQTNQPIVGATVIAIYSSTSQTSVSAADGSYILIGIPLGTSTRITASYIGYQSKTIQQVFSQAQVYVWDFVIYNASAVATINGKVTNAKTMLPEPGVMVTHRETGAKTLSDANGDFNLAGIPFGEGDYDFLKEGFINKTFLKDITQNPFQWEVFEPITLGKEIKVTSNFSGIVLDSFTQKAIIGALVQVIGRPIQGTTDSNGHFSLSGIDFGSCNISITALHYSALEIHALVDDSNPTECDFSLNPICLGKIKGKITNTDGDAIKGVQIGMPTGGIIAAQTGYSGEYEIAVLPIGTHSIEFFHPCYEKFTQSITINQEGESLDLDVSLVERSVEGQLNGRVIDKSSKEGIGNAAISIEGTSISTLSDPAGSFSFSTAPLGVIKLRVEASGYSTRNCERYVEVSWNDPNEVTIAESIELEQISSATTTTPLSQQEDQVDIIVEATKGGTVSSPDGRLELIIAPDILPADLRFFIAQETEVSALSNGDLIPLQQSEQPDESYILGKTIRLTVSSAKEGDPVPDFKIPVVLVSRFMQNEVKAFGGAEETAGFYFTTSNDWYSGDIIPNQYFVDPYNNIVGSLVILDSQKMSAQTFSQSIQTSSLAMDPIKIIRIVLGVKKLIKLLEEKPPMVTIYDKNQLNAVTSAESNEKPNPNALPLLVFNGLVPKTKWTVELPDPNKDIRYNRILEDLVQFSNGVYRPVFVSYNTAAHIDGNGLLAAQVLHPDGLGKFIKFRGIPADPDSQTSGQFSHVDTFGFSMGGLVSRYYSHFTGGYVRNMLMLATPNHGTLLPIFDILGKMGKTALIQMMKIVNTGIGDLIDYPDDSPEAFTINPKLAFLNQTGLPPSGDISLWAGTNFTAYPIIGLLLFKYYGDNDSIVPVTSVYCRPTAEPTGDSSLLKVMRDSQRYEYIHPFSHDDVGTSFYPLNNFEEEIRRGLSDWVVYRSWESTETPFDDNHQQLPTATQDGEVRAMVTLEYNVWDGYEGRAKRDIDRAVIVIYYKDALGEWHIAKSNTNQNGADPEGNVNDGKVIPIIKSSKAETNPDKKKLSAIATLEANPAFGEIGYDPGKDVKEVRTIVITLKPGQKTVPKDPLGANFAVPY